jgi:hypothetical protein
LKPGKNMIQSVSKGYRLKPSTHNMVRKLQMNLNITQDKVIRAAMKLYSEHIKNSNKKIKGAA